MLLIIARFTVQPDRREDYIRLAEQMAAASSAEEGCISFRLARHRTDPDSFAFIEKWRDQAAIDAHNQTDHFRTLVPQMRAMRTASAMDIYDYEE